MTSLAELLGSVRRQGADDAAVLDFRAGGGVEEEDGGIGKSGDGAAVDEQQVVVGGIVGDAALGVGRG